MLNKKTFHLPFVVCKTLPSHCVCALYLQYCTSLDTSTCNTLVKCVMTVIMRVTEYFYKYTLTFGSARALITFPRARSERLMLAPSRKRAPLALVALALSEPARSIRLILAMHTLGLRLAVLSCCLKYIWKKGYKTVNSRMSTSKL